MTKLFTQNKKMTKSTNDKYLVFNFGIVAYQSKTGFKTCPMAGECAKGCYAQQGTYKWSNVNQAFEYRLKLTQSDDFNQFAKKELDLLVKRSVKQNKTLVIRIHDSGDFYNIDYLNKWIEIINNYPGVKFYAYTKMIPMFELYKKTNDLPVNFRVIYSEGGLADKKIKTSVMFHSRVFKTAQDLLNNGYADASKDDLIAAVGDNNKIGLIYHGASSKEWTTG